MHVFVRERIAQIPQLTSVVQSSSKPITVNLKDEVVGVPDDGTEKGNGIDTVHGCRQLDARPTDEDLGLQAYAALELVELSPRISHVDGRSGCLFTVEVLEHEELGSVLGRLLEPISGSRCQPGRRAVRWFGLVGEPDLGPHEEHGFHFKAAWRTSSTHRSVPGIRIHWSKSQSARYQV